MKRILTTAIAMSLATAVPALADTVKVGYMTTLSGGAGIIGKQMQNAVNLAMEHTGGKLGGMDAEVIFVDDQRKPDVAKQLANRLVKSDKVDVVAGVIWSNHGGRQQDRVPPTLHTVAQEMPRVGDTQLDFMMDGGVRNGTDVLIALTYGLKAVGIGRVTAAGIGAGGPDGLRRAFQILSSDLDRAMRLVGVQSTAELRERGAELRRDSLMAGDGHLPPFVF